MHDTGKGDRLIALFLLGALLLTPPMLAIFNVDTLFLGIPLLFLYLFGVWVGLILLLWLALGRRGEPPDGDGAPADGG